MTAGNRAQPERWRIQERGTGAREPPRTVNSGYLDTIKCSLKGENEITNL